MGVCGVREPVGSWRPVLPRVPRHHPRRGRRPVISWWTLLTIREQQRQEFDYFVDVTSHIACPRDGEPLIYAPALEDSSGIEKYCKFCGWQYPRDWIRPEHP